MTFSHLKINFTKFGQYRLKIRKVVIEFFDFQSLIQRPLCQNSLKEANIYQYLKRNLISLKKAKIFLKGQKGGACRRVLEEDLTHKSDEILAD